MSEHKEPIPSRIYNAAVGGHVAGAEDIFDDAMNKDQHTINIETTTGLNSKLNSSEKGAVNGVASLDGSGKVPSSQLPSYVDDVIEGYFYDGDFYSDAEHTEIITPESDKIYIDVISNKSYRWTGSVYFPINNPFTPDEEDLTIKNDKLKLANKAYDSASFSGMGRVYLRKNIVSNVNTLTQDMFYKGAAGSRTPNTNTVFIIQYDYTLAENITIPDNCVLQFDGGSIDGLYTLTGSNTCIKSPVVQVFGMNITIIGTWNVSDVYSDWFAFDNSDCTKSFRNMIRLSKSEIHTTVHIRKGEYYIQGYDDENSTPGVIHISSNTTIENKGVIRILPTNNEQSFPLYLFGVHDVEIFGGKIIGSNLYYETSPGEFGYGIAIRGSKNVIIRDMYISNCFGDGINIQYSTSIPSDCENILIDNVVFENNSRQGISIETANNIEVRSCLFKGTGSVLGRAPGNGVDVEPNYDDAQINNVRIHHCMFVDNVRSVTLSKITNGNNILVDHCISMNDGGGALNNLSSNTNVIISNSVFTKIQSTRPSENVRIENCKITDISLRGGTTGFRFVNCELGVLANPNAFDFTITSGSPSGINGEILFENCIIFGGSIISTIEGDFKFIGCHIYTTNTYPHIPGTVINCYIEVPVTVGLKLNSKIKNTYINIKNTGRASDYSTQKGMITIETPNLDYSIEDSVIRSEITTDKTIRGYSSHGDWSNHARLKLSNVKFDNFSKDGNHNVIDITYAKGFELFDGTLLKPIFWNGTAWVDATGATI